MPKSQNPAAVFPPSKRCQNCKYSERVKLCKDSEPRGVSGLQVLNKPVTRLSRRRVGSLNIKMSQNAVWNHHTSCIQSQPVFTLRYDMLLTYHAKSVNDHSKTFPFHKHPFGNGVLVHPNTESWPTTGILDPEFFVAKISSLLRRSHHQAFPFCCIHPGKLTWNPQMEVWKMIFLSNWITFRFQPLFFRCVLYRISGMPRNSAEWHPVCSTQGPRSTSSDDARPPRNSYWSKTESGHKSILQRCTYIANTIIFDALICIYIHIL